MLQLDVNNDTSTENRTLEQTGVVRVFPISTDGVQPEPLFVLDGDQSFSRFGTAVLVNATIFKTLNGIGSFCDVKSEG